jgi:hypothetical protein
LRIFWVLIHTAKYIDIESLFSVADPGLGCVAPMASYPVSLDAGINSEIISSSSRGPRIPGLKSIPRQLESKDRHNFNFIKSLIFIEF